MSQLSKILRDAVDNGLTFWCPGCNEAHGIKHGAGGWKWNGDAERPVFSPSIDVTSVEKLTDEEYATWLRDKKLPEPRPTKCHSFVGSSDGSTPGKIQFLSDCTHALRGQTVDLPEWPQRSEP